MASDREAWVGRRLGSFRLLRLLGEGGMGAVFEAEDTQLSRRVALKMLTNKVADEPEALGRFLREAAGLGSLNHPHVVQIHSIEDDEGMYFLVMELMEGGTVGDLIRSGGPVPWREATRLIADACQGLAAVHAAG